MSKMEFGMQISEKWIDFVRTAAPSTAERQFYGGQWWLVPDDRK
jgi:hypothetical protein